MEIITGVPNDVNLIIMLNVCEGGEKIKAYVFNNMVS